MDLRAVGLIGHPAMNYIASTPSFVNNVNIMFDKSYVLINALESSSNTRFLLTLNLD